MWRELDDDELRKTGLVRGITNTRESAFDRWADYIGVADRADAHEPSYELELPRLDACNSRAMLGNDRASVLLWVEQVRDIMDAIEQFVGA